MAAYIPLSACNGSKPKHLVDTALFTRSALLVRMMENRTVLRYLIAPAGFGKSFLACNYAQIVFGLRNTFWLSAQHPCFLRDLDAGTLCADLLHHSDDGALVVFDDVPRLDGGRNTAFMETCAQLIDAGREVVVASTPACDPLATWDRACVKIESSEMLYTEQDFHALRALTAGMVADKMPDCPALRIPALALNEKDAQVRFLAAHIADIDDAYENAFTFATVVLERGTFSDLSQAIGRALHASDFSVARVRPFAVVNEYRQEFSAAGFEMHDIVCAYAPYIKRFAEALGAKDASSFVCALADALVRRRNPDRAAQLLISLCEPAARARWLARRQIELLDACALVALDALNESLKDVVSPGLTVLHIGHMVCRCLLNAGHADTEQLLRIARRSSLMDEERLLAATCALLCDGDAGRAAGGWGALDSAMATMKVRNGLSDPLYGLQVFWNHVPQCAGDVKRLCDDVASQDISAFSTALALACCVRMVRTHAWKTDVLQSSLNQAVELAMARCAADRFAGIAELALVRELCACGRGVDAALPAADREVLVGRLRQYRADVREQRERHACGSLCLTSSTLRQTRGMHSAARITSTELVPPLEVHMFGRFDVCIGDVHVPHERLSRQKTRILLVLLALSVGKDVACEYLYQLMWPASTNSKARHNFYSIFSSLRRALELPSGDCPYLVRNQGICRLESAYVRTDVEELERLCRKLRGDSLEPDAAESTFERLLDVYRGDLLPGDGNDDAVSLKRAHWRNLVVDALLQASVQLVRADQKSMALHFAQQALEFDPQREECYGTLMTMQALNGDRPVASKVWLQYHRFITVDLGMEPSPRIERLYQNIVSGAWKCEADLLMDL